MAFTLLNCKQKPSHGSSLARMPSKHGTYDIERTQILEKQGYKMVRIWNNDVFTHPDEVLELILKALE